MKRLLALTALMTIMAIQLNGQTGNSAGTGAQTTPGSQGGASQTLPPGSQNNQQFQPGLRQPMPVSPGVQGTNQFGFANTNQFRFGTNRFGTFTNQFGIGTNQFLASSNQFGFTTNQFGIVTTNVVGVLTNQFGVDTNLSPASGSNAPNRIYNIPPGLERRRTLPPGLENRQALPPGLERPTNAALPGTGTP